MIKNYTNNSKPQVNKLPKKSTIDFILNYSKGINVLKASKIDFIIFKN